MKSLMRRLLQRRLHSNTKSRSQHPDKPAQVSGLTQAITLVRNLNWYKILMIDKS